MVQVPEQIANWNKAQIDTFNRFAEIVVDATEELANLNIKTLRSGLAEGVQNAKVIADVKEPREAAQIGATQVQPSAERAVAYARNVYEIVAGAQGELRQLIEERIAEANKQVVAALDVVSKSGPAGSEVAVAAVKSAIAAANTAYGNLSKVAKQVVDLTEANVAAATQAVVSNTKKKAA
jgi:phasin family protein